MPTGIYLRTKKWKWTEASKKKLLGNTNGKGNKGKLLSETAKENMSKAHLGKSSTKGKHWKLSDQAKKNIGSGSKGRIPSPKCGHGKRSHYESPFQGTVCFRSSYELAYAKWLDKHGINWLYESRTFDLGNTTYTPDFYLSEENKYIEVKGYMYPSARAKIDAFREKFSQVTLEIMFWEDLRRIGCKI